jgi:hypothetical protein
MLLVAKLLLGNDQISAQASTYAPYLIVSQDPFCAAKWRAERFPIDLLAES